MSQEGSRFITWMPPASIEDDPLQKARVTILLVYNEKALTCLAHILRIFGYNVLESLLT
jgi:hypothetical protein